MELSGKLQALRDFFANEDKVERWIDLSDTPSGRFDVACVSARLTPGWDAGVTHLTPNGFLYDEVDPAGERHNEQVLRYEDADAAAINLAYQALQEALTWTAETSRYSPIIEQ